MKTWCRFFVAAVVLVTAACATAPVVEEQVEYTPPPVECLSPGRTCALPRRR